MNYRVHDVQSSALQPWHNNLTLEFIELYKNEPVLWNPAIESRKNKVEMNDAWERIQNTISVECSVDELKRKKESLMTTYRVHARRKREDPNYRTAWYAFAHLDSFLSNIYNPEPLLKGQQGIEDQLYSHIDNKSIILENCKKRKSTTSGIRDGNKSGERNLSVLRTPVKAKGEIRPSYFTPGREMDECDLYAQLLAKKLRKLNEDQRDFAMHQIDNIVYQAKLSRIITREEEVNQEDNHTEFIIAEPDTEEYEVECLESEDDQMS